MAKKYIKLTSLLLLTPCLMAVSTEREETCINQGYKNMEVSLVNKAENNYFVSLKNTGEGYISISSDLTCNVDNSQFLYVVLSGSEVFGRNILLAPGETYNGEWTNSSTYTDFANYSYSTVAFVNPETTLKYSKEKTISKASKGDDYILDCNVTGLSKDYDYYFAITLDYNGTSYCIQSNLITDYRISFTCSNADFDVSKATVTKIDAFKVKASSNKLTKFFRSMFVSLSTITGAPYLIAFAGVLALAFVGVFVWYFISHRKKKRLARAAASASESIIENETKE